MRGVYGLREHPHTPAQAREVPQDGYACLRKHCINSYGARAKTARWSVGRA